MTFFQAILLKCLIAIKEERTVYSIYHILKGKKSSQSIQDSHLYGLRSYFQLFPMIERKEFDQTMQEMNDLALVEKTSEIHFRATSSGIEALEQYSNLLSEDSHVDGNLQDSMLVFWKRLTLLIQVMSHLIRRESHYYPIQRERELLQWIKLFLKRNRNSREKIAYHTYEELKNLLNKQTFENPMVFILRLTGQGRIGLTMKQAAAQLQLEETEYYFRFMNVLHYFMKEILASPQEYPILASLIEDSIQPLPMTASTIETYYLLKQNHSIMDISAMRRLQPSTIEDHIIEIAINDPNFLIEPFVSRDESDHILMAAKQNGGLKLKPIKEAVPDASYFQIRLVLAKCGGNR
ncbi:helix-turn-helix domain-containing protein [Falsibacillus albus]|nr:helix-turn-helix domain-containing protein [Falsibacillus albus]